jgi:hypothetical protein
MHATFTVSMIHTSSEFVLIFASEAHDCGELALCTPRSIVDTGLRAALTNGFGCLDPFLHGKRAAFK